MRTQHAPLLNRLSEMQAAPYYAVAKAVLAQAEAVIVQLEEELAVTDKLLSDRNAVIATIPACGVHGDQCLPNAREWVASASKAFEIADECMYELIEAHGVAQDEYRTTFGLVDDASAEVTCLAEACGALRDAVGWLQPRGFVELNEDKDGEYIAVLRRPGEH